jgi:hypothetical protein
MISVERGSNKLMPSPSNTLERPPRKATIGTDQIYRRAMGQSGLERQLIFLWVDRWKNKIVR